MVVLTAFWLYYSILWATILLGPKNGGFSTIKANFTQIMATKAIPLAGTEK